jgi:ATP-dependent Lon protease
MNNPNVIEAKEMVRELFVIGNDTANRYTKRENDYNYEVPGPKSVSDYLVELEGTYISSFDNRKKILSSEDKECTVVFSKKSVIGMNIKEEKDDRKIRIGDKLYIVAIRTDQNIFVAVTCIRSEDKWMFEQVKSLYGKACAIKNFILFFKDKPLNKEYIRKQLGGRKYKRYDPSTVANFSSRREQALKYAMTRENITTEAQCTMEALFNESSTSRRKTEKRLEYMSNIIPEYVDRKPVTEEDLIKLFNEKIYKQEKAKNQLIDLIISTQRANKRGFNVCLVGAPGTGKTLIAQVVLEGMNIPSVIIPLDGIAASFVLKGLDAGYESADAGMVTKGCRPYGTSEVGVVLEEADKMNRDTKEGDPMNTLYSLLLGEHEDEFLGCRISTENTVFIATCNSIDNIPDPIRNRFDAIIWLDEYSVEDKVMLGKEYIIPEIEENYGLGEKSINISDNIIRYIATEYCEDGGTRDLKYNLEKVVQRIIRTQALEMQNNISEEYVKNVLGPAIEVTPSIFFNRHIDDYSDFVADAIRTCISKNREASYRTGTNISDDRNNEKLRYLLACRNDKDENDLVFDPQAFYNKLHAGIYGMDNVINEVLLFYHTAFLQGKLFNTNLALCGAYGTGKTSIVGNIADAMRYKFVKISLNGVNDAKELRGFPFSEPGRIMKGVYKAKSLKAIFLLDEIDKLKPENAVVLLDLLDREFTDNFLDVPVNFDESIFIATANDWSNVPPVIRDRFIVINVDGYTREEKAEIVSEYIIPKMEKGYTSGDVSISIDNNARSYLLETYCPSFGVRDAEKAMQKIVSSKLLDQAGTGDGYNIHINKDDVKKYLGDEPIPRGNFPKNGDQPGIAKALAVSNGNLGNAFAIETVLVDGSEGLEMTGLPKESASDSAKIAITCIRKLYPGILNNKFIHIHFGEGSVQKDGPSAGIALFMSIYSAAVGRPIMIDNPYDVAFTGELSLTGGVFAVGGVMEKIQAACDSGCRMVFIPMLNYEHMDRSRLEQFDCEIVPVSHVSEVIDKVFG